MIAIAACVMSALAVIAVLASGLAWLLKLVVISATIAIASISLRRYLRPRYTRIAHGESGWRLLDARDEEFPATLCRHGRIGAFVILDFALDRSSYRCVLAPDVVDPETRRRLSLALARA
ncbi:MAG: hypothetical protein ABI451_07380 [Dokdonella sp.]